MQKILFVFLTAAFFMGMTSVYSVTPAHLQQQRIEVVKKYVKLLGRGDYQGIPKLFTDHAVAVAPTGEADTINRFYDNLFKKSFSSPESKLINIFEGRIKDNMMTAYYDLSWVNTQGQLESAKFVDLFIFQQQSAKIKTIYVFSNSFQEDVFS